jgi:hypothetical protein
VRLVDLGRPLPRPQAANAGLDAARGAMLGFLDDDDTFDGNHVSLLMRHYNPMKPLQVMYAGARVLSHDGSVLRLMYHPYNPIMLMVNMYIQTGAALFSRGFLALGCRFDESLELAEDWDLDPALAVRAVHPRRRRHRQLSRGAGHVRHGRGRQHRRDVVGTDGRQGDGQVGRPPRSAMDAGQELLADAQRALASGDRERAHPVDQIFAKYQIRFALEPVEGGEAR